MSFSVPLHLLSQCQLIIDPDPTAQASYRLQAVPSSGTVDNNPRSVGSGHISTNIDLRSTLSNGKLILEVTANGDSMALVRSAHDTEVPGLAAFDQEDISNSATRESVHFPPSNTLDEYLTTLPTADSYNRVAISAQWDSIFGLEEPSTTYLSSSSSIMASGSTQSAVPELHLASETVESLSSWGDSTLFAGSPASWEVEDSSAQTDPNGSDQSRARPFPCSHPLCGRSFTSKYTLETHMLSHQPKKRQSYQCTIGCGALFSRKHDRQRHEVSQHAKPTPWTCSYCSNFFSSEKTLSAHAHHCQHRHQGDVPVP